MPAMKLSPAIRPMTTRKPVLLSERCGVSSAENSAGSASGGLRALLSLMLSIIPASWRARRPRYRKRNRGDPGNRSRGLRPKSRKPFAASRRQAPRRPRSCNSINPYTLLVAVVLSAQATDAGVNKATPALFAAADTPEKMAALGEERVRDFIKTIGLYRNKAKNVVELSRRLVAEHGGKVPRDREALEALPGVGRKTANVVLNVAFGEPTIAVDTHIFRVGNRTNMAPGLTPFEVELNLNAGRAGQIQAARAPLADPARPLHLHRAQAAVREVHHQRPVPLAGEDRRLSRHARGLVPGIARLPCWSPGEKRMQIATDAVASWAGNRADVTGHFALDADAHSIFWRRGHELLAALPEKPKRNPEQARAAETILRVGRESREAFLAHHAETVYRKLTRNMTAFVRADVLAYEAASLVPGLTPTRAQVYAQGEKMQSQKDGIEVDQGIFFAHILARPDSRHAFLPRHAAAAHRVARAT